MPFHYEDFGYEGWTSAPQYNAWLHIVEAAIRETGDLDALRLVAICKTREALKRISGKHPDTYKHMKSVYVLLFT